jgi:hypothetical protein
MKRTPPRRRAPLRAKDQLRRSTPLRRTPAMAASDAQRVAVAGRACIVCGADRRIDPAHLLSVRGPVEGRVFPCLFSCRHVGTRRRMMINARDCRCDAIRGLPREGESR